MKNRHIQVLSWLFIILSLSACQASPAPTPPSSIIESKINPIDQAVLVYVPAGEFLMGSEDEDAWEDESPEHLVYLDAFWIYQTEVTNQQYNLCVEAGACDDVSDNDNDYPVTGVFRRDGRQYCEWAGGRLPTEAEWEKAARGTDGRKFPWGNQPPTCDLANFADCLEGTAPVGSYPQGASPYGALDMAGNVWEWVSDGYEPAYYSLSPYENPTGPSGGGYDETMRGGSWLDWPRYLRVTARFANEGLSDPIILEAYGFRCVHPDG